MVSLRIDALYLDGKQKFFPSMADYKSLKFNTFIEQWSVLNDNKERSLDFF